MLSVFERVLLRPLDFYEPERLGLMRIDVGQLRAHPGLSPAEAIDLRRAGIFESVEAETRLAEASLGRGPEFISLSQLQLHDRHAADARRAAGRSAATSRKPTCRCRCRRRRAACQRRRRLPPPPPPPQKALLDYGAWQKHFGGDRAVLGRIVFSERPARPRSSAFCRRDSGSSPAARCRSAIDIYTPLRLGRLPQRLAVPDARAAEARHDVRGRAGRARHASPRATRRSFRSSTKSACATPSRPCSTT